MFFFSLYLGGDGELLCARDKVLLDGSLELALGLAVKVLDSGDNGLNLIRTKKKIIIIRKSLLNLYTSPR